MVDAEVYRYNGDVKLYTFRYASSIEKAINKQGQPIWQYRDVYPEYSDDTHTDLRIKIISTLIDATGITAEGKGSIDDQIFRIGEIMTKEHGVAGSTNPALYLRVYWSGAADYTDYNGHFNFINVNVSNINNRAIANAEFQVADTYFRN